MDTVRSFSQIKSRCTESPAKLKALRRILRDDENFFQEMIHVLCSLAPVLTSIFIPVVEARRGRSYVLRRLRQTPV